MADKKISALTPAATPLAGTEVLPIVQSGTTVKATIANVVGAGTSPGSFSSVATTGDVALNSATDATITRYGTGTYGPLILRFKNGPNVNTPGIKLQTANLAGVYTDRMVINTDSDTPTMTIYPTITQGIAGNGINFTANTPQAGMTSQLLNWYEEGTWTPGQGAGLVVVGSFSSTGFYTRIGRQVTVIGTLTGSTSVACSASGVLTNLPFVCRNALPSGNLSDTNTQYTQCFGIQTTANLYAGGAIAATSTIYFELTYFV